MTRFCHTPRTGRVVRALVAGVALAALAGCSSDPAQGYSFRSTYPKAVRTVSVDVFDNQTFQHGLELELTDAIIKEIQRTTPMVVVRGAAADSTLTGRIRAAQLENLTTSGRTGLVQEMAMRVEIDFDWLDTRTGQPLASVAQLSMMEPFVSQRGVGERIDAGRQQVAQELARRVVGHMRADW